MLRSSLAFLLLFVGAAGPAAAASPDPKSLDIPAEEMSKARELVKQLGSEQFDDREQAETELAKMGRLARPALLEGVNTDPSPEVRSRCSALLPKATSLDMRARLDVFLADTEGRYEHDLPGWNQFRSTVRNEWTLFGHTVGSDHSLDKAARAVFADLISTPENRFVVMAVGGPPTDLGQIVAWRRQELYYQKYPRPALGARGGFRAGGLESPVRRDPTTEDIAALLFAESHSHSKFVPRSVSVANLISASGFGNAARDSDEKGKVYRSVAVAWLESRHDPVDMSNAMTVAATLDMTPQACRLAIQLFEAKGVQVYYRGNAAATLARLGGKEHIPVMEKAMADAGVLYTLRKPVPGLPANEWETHDIQVRDVALAVALTLSAQNLEDYGFVDQNKASGLPGGAGGYAYTRYYLPEDKRQAAFDKWKEWRERGTPAEKEPGKM